MRDLNAWLDRKKPYQRELLFTIAFGLCAIAAVVSVGAALMLVWPSLLSLVLISAALMGVPIAVVGQLAGYRIEDRRAAQRKSVACVDVR